MESKIARDKINYFISCFQRMQHPNYNKYFKIPYMVVLLTICGFLPATRADLTTTNACIQTEQGKCYDNYMFGTPELDQCVLSVASKCPPAEEPKTNIAQCISQCNDNPDCVTKCQCTTTETYNPTTKKCESTQQNDKPTTTPEWDQTVMWITIGPKCLKNGQCSFKIYDLLGIKQDIPEASRTSATFFVQDILLAATFFIGTIITLALIRSGVMYILAGTAAKDPTNAKQGIKYSIIWLLLVIGSYSIIRLVQYVAKGF